MQDLVPLYNVTDRKFGDGANDIIEMYNRFIIRVEMLDLLDIADAKPLLDVCILVLFGRHVLMTSATKGSSGREYPWCQTRSLDWASAG